MATDKRAIRRERQSRLKRLLLVGAGGSLVFFAGLIAAQDLANPAPVASMTTSQVATQNSENTRIPSPRIRTRTS